MTNRLLAVLAVALAPAPVFAIDGVVLINQSTVMAAGGFPYVISSSGSYKLSGNLTMNTSPSGNFLGSDIATVITAGHVALDLNGFSITIVNNISKLTHSIVNIYAPVVEPAITIRNGSLSWGGTGTTAIGFQRIGIYIIGSFSRVEDISAFLNATLGEYFLTTAHNSIIRHVITDGLLEVSCPSVVSESIGRLLLETLGNSCASAANADYVP